MGKLEGGAPTGHLRVCLEHALSLSAHREGRYFSSRSRHFPTSIPGFEKGIPSLSPRIPRRGQAKGRVSSGSSRERRGKLFFNDHPSTPALTLLVVRDTKASLRHGQAERRSQTWFQDSFPCANLTSSTRNGLFSRAVVFFFFFLTWSGSCGQKYSGKPVCSGFSLAPWGFSRGNLTPFSPAPKDVKITDPQQSLKISV